MLRKNKVFLLLDRDQAGGGVPQTAVENLNSDTSSVQHVITHVPRVTSVKNVISSGWQPIFPAIFS